MTEFRVHFIKTDGNKTTHVVNADSPAQAAAMIRRKNPGVNVTKVKVNKAGNVSVRQAVKSGFLPEFKVGTAPQIPLYDPSFAQSIAERAQEIIRDNGFHNQFMQETDGIETTDIAVLGDEFVTTIVTRRG